VDTDNIIFRTKSDIVKKGIYIVVLLVGYMLMRLEVNQTLIELLILICLGVSMIPGLGLPTLNIIASIISFFIFLIKKFGLKNADDNEFAQILARYYGYKEPDAPWYDGIVRKIPFVGKKYAAEREKSLSESMIEFLIHTVLYVLSVFIIGKIIDSLLVPVILKSVTGRTKGELIINYIILVWNKVKGII